MKIYVDMDQVLTDFNKRAADLLGRKFGPGDDLSKEDWKAITEAGKDFWSEMEWLDDGKRLWDQIKKYDPTILSAPSQSKTSVEGKKAWLKREIPGYDYIIDADKEKYAKDNAILIDDRKKNTDKWEAAGGKSILHKSYSDTMEKLKNMIQSPDMKKEAAVLVLDRIADDLQKRGMIEEAYHIDVISNTLEKMADIDKSTLKGIQMLWDRFRTNINEFVERVRDLIKKNRLSYRGDRTWLERQLENITGRKITLTPASFAVT